MGKRSSVPIAWERMFIQCANRPALYGLSKAGGKRFAVGEKRAFNGASMGGWINAAEDKLRRESILIRAVGGGVDKSSCRDGENSGT